MSRFAISSFVAQSDIRALEHRKPLTRISLPLRYVLSPQTVKVYLLAKTGPTQRNVTVRAEMAILLGLAILRRTMVLISAFILVSSTGRLSALRVILAAISSYELIIVHCSLTNNEHITQNSFGLGHPLFIVMSS
ncbi:hypothetical protein ES703_105720 [subsurface metagenome]